MATNGTISLVVEVGFLENRDKANNMLSERAKEVTCHEWRELGFYYDSDEEKKKWRVIGAKKGLHRFSELLRQYAKNKGNREISEHENFGPYSYLEIGTWNEPEITEHWIAGPLESLMMLAETIDEAVIKHEIGQSFSLRQAFSPSSPYDLELEIRSENFDPVSEDPNFSNS